MRSLLSLASLAGGGRALSTLIFHRVLPEADELFPGEIIAPEFDELCRWLSNWCTVLRLDDAVRLLAASQLPARAVCITFDDGYADNATLAVPILQRHGLTATFFIASGFLGGGRMWNDTVVESIRRTRSPCLDLGSLGLEGVGRFELRGLDDRRAAIRCLLSALKHLPLDQRLEAVQAVAECASAVLPDDLMMTRDQVRGLHTQGMGVGAHTVNHPILATLSDSQAEREIGEGREVLQHIIGDRVSLFAYPNGRPGADYLSRDVDLVRTAGFAAAVSTAWGVARPGCSVYELPRFTPWDRVSSRFGLRLARNLLQKPRVLEGKRLVRGETR